MAKNERGIIHPEISAIPKEILRAHVFDAAKRSEIEI